MNPYLTLRTARKLIRAAITTNAITDKQNITRRANQLLNQVQTDNLLMQYRKQQLLNKLKNLTK